MIKYVKKKLFFVIEYVIDIGKKYIIVLNYFFSDIILVFCYIIDI